MKEDGVVVDYSSVRRQTELEEKKNTATVVTANAC